MTPFTLEALARATHAVHGMRKDQKLQLSDEIYAQQPALLGSILSLSLNGVPSAQLEVAVNILLIVFQTLKTAGVVLRPITEEDMLAGSRRILDLASVCDHRSAADFDGAMEAFCLGHPQQNLLAFVIFYLKDHDLISVRTEAEKHLVHACNVLVESVADALLPTPCSRPAEGAKQT